jgi:short-subunit dehydrogenase
MKNHQPRPVRQQCIVITGASSGIGLATARLAAKRGAKVVLSSRNIRELEQIAKEIRAEGGQALAVQADVSDLKQLQKLADRAVAQFGRIDTWVNNAAASIYGPLLEIPEKEERMLFDTNFWGVRHGCHVAVECMRDQGGVIINLGSEVSQRSIPLQGMYAASKHAIKAYTDALRQELEHDRMPIDVCLIRPTAIDTPFTEHAVNHLRMGEPSLPKPAYHPIVVARAILLCAVQPKRDVFVGGMSILSAVMDWVFPRVADKVFPKKLYKEQTQGTRIGHNAANEGLMSPPAREGRERGGHKGKVKGRAHNTTRLM